MSSELEQERPVVIDERLDEISDEQMVTGHLLGLHKHCEEMERKLGRATSKEEVNAICLSTSASFDHCLAYIHTLAEPEIVQALTLNESILQARTPESLRETFALVQKFVATTHTGTN